MVLDQDIHDRSNGTRPPLPILFVQHLIFLSALGLSTVIVAATGSGRCGQAGMPKLILDNWDGFQLWMIVLLHGVALTVAGACVRRHRLIYLAALSLSFLLAARKPLGLLTERVCASRACDMIGLDEALTWAGALLCVSAAIATGIRTVLDARQDRVIDRVGDEPERGVYVQLAVVALASMIFGFGVTMALRSRCLIDMSFATLVMFYVHLDLFLFTTIAFVAFMTHIGRRTFLKLLPGALLLFAICSGLVLTLRGRAQLPPIAGLEETGALTSILLVGLICIGSALMSWGLVLPFLPATTEAPPPKPDPRPRRDTAREPLNRPRKDSTRGVIQRPSPDDDWQK